MAAKPKVHLLDDAGPLCNTNSLTGYLGADQGCEKCFSLVAHALALLKEIAGGDDAHVKKVQRLLKKMKRLPS
jgi:hypothetical protein